MVLAESVVEAVVGDEAAPALADEGGIEEPCGVVGWEAEEDLLHELVHMQCHRLRHAASCRQSGVAIGFGLDWLGNGQNSEGKGAARFAWPSSTSSMEGCLYQVGLAGAVGMD